ncbi:MAG: OmpA family protein [Spirochaetaceae bacterium]|nr:OmpA family protein [Spirochaetaceae bacterium]
MKIKHMDFTCVEIKNVKYIKLIPLDRKCKKELDLTTIHREQELAYLNIYYVDNNKNKKLLKCVEINNIRPGSSGIPELHLSVYYDGSQFYKIVLKLNGFIYHNSVVDIKQFRKKPPRFANTILITLALIVLSLLVFFSVKTLKNNRSGSIVSDSQINKDIETEQAAVEQAAADQAAADQAAADQAAADQQAAVEQTAAEQTAAEQTASDQAAADQVASDQAAVDQAMADQATAEQAASEQAASEQAASEQAASDEGLLEEEPAIESELVDDKAIVYFNPNQSDLTASARSILYQVLQILKQDGNLYVEITGHCAYYGTEKGRQEISTHRAENVYTFFINNGWVPVNKPRLAGLGHQQIVTKDPNRQNLNRRVEIIIKSTKEEY